jgi:hypothetical protein
MSSISEKSAPTSSMPIESDEAAEERILLQPLAHIAQSPGKNVRLTLVQVNIIDV